MPILNASNPEGSTRRVDFNASKLTLFATRANKCHLKLIVYDQDREAGLAECLERTPEVLAYAKNHNLGFKVPYEYGGETLCYRRVYIAIIDDGSTAPLNLVIEVRGRRDDKDAAEVDTMRNIRVPVVNNAKRYGRRNFLEHREAYRNRSVIPKSAAI